MIKAVKTGDLIVKERSKKIHEVLGVDSRGFYKIIARDGRVGNRSFLVSGTMMIFFYEKATDAMIVDALSDDLQIQLDINYTKGL